MLQTRSKEVRSRREYTWVTVRPSMLETASEHRKVASHRQISDAQTNYSQREMRCTKSL